MPYLTPDDFGTKDTLRLVQAGATPYILGALNGALLELTDTQNWEQFGALTPQQCADYFLAVWREYVNSSMIGVILPYASAVRPTFSLDCDGATHRRINYPALYAVIDPVFIIDADFFRVPDLRGNFPLGTSASHAIGTTGGLETVTLTTPQLPAHFHRIAPHTHTEITATPTVIAIGAGVPAPSAVPSIGVTGTTNLVTNTTGLDQPHENMPPFQTVRYCIVAL